MFQSSEQSIMDGTPLARSVLYRLLAAAFRYPTRELFQHHAGGAFLTELWETMSRLPHLRQLPREEAGLKDKVRTDLAETTFQDFEVGYTRTFDVGSPTPPCPPYEGAYRQGVERTQLMVEISELYRHFGLAMNREEGKRELPDHLSAELELLHFLTFKEAQAAEDGATELLRGYVLAQRDFLERHMVSWLPTFCERLQRTAEVPLYGDLARVTLSFVTSELRWAQERLRELDQ